MMVYTYNAGYTISCIIYMCYVYGNLQGKCLYIVLSECCVTFKVELLMHTDDSIQTSDRSSATVTSMFFFIIKLTSQLQTTLYFRQLFDDQPK